MRQHAEAHLIQNKVKNPLNLNGKKPKKEMSLSITVSN